MQKDINIRMLISPFMAGIVLGITAKFADGREPLYYFPIFADIMGRFGIWVWAAALTAIRSKTPLLAAARSTVFFTGMLMAYYGYTVLFLGFFPKSQMILWGIVAMATPFCGFLIFPDGGSLSGFSRCIPVFRICGMEKRKERQRGQVIWDKRS